MNEREQPERQQEPTMRIEYHGLKFELKPSNTAAFLHEEEPQYDHLFYSQDGGYFYLFRQAAANFDQVVEYMRQCNYEVNDLAFASDMDKQQYFDTFGYPEIKTRELTAREERKLAFARYLLDMEHITPESFNGNGTMA